ncbi:putative sodium-coupled neutral amino acid transporter 6 isoform X3 [Apostichopus japonicus]|uniref:Putative sodium-coupled neutral amino acid transporter 6 isoform X3 n=1 Tax=Stichopus japonicus TaxID=307972 RepID=A0A2G8L7L8_STIJA|nr:putative sodium-coupled neutral amino acid transporter 6 isoform X3 [Apostichopus japonicus]
MAFVILPLSCLPKIGFLSYTSSFSVISMTFFMIVVVVEKFRLPCPIPHPQLMTTAEPYYTEATQGWDSMKASSHDNSTCQPKYVTISVDTAYAIPTMTFSFVCHTAVIPIYKELSSPTKARMLGVSVTALLACFVLYFTTGIFGYLTFYENVNSELLLSYSQYPSPIPIISVVRLIVLIAIIFHLPVIHFPCRISLMMLMQMILPRMAPSRAYVIGIHVTSTLILLSTITFIALVVPDIRVIFGLFGATSSVCLMLFLPSLFYILIAPGALYSPRKIIPCVMFVSSFLILGVSLTTIIYGFVHPKK